MDGVEPAQGARSVAQHSSGRAQTAAHPLMTRARELHHPHSATLHHAAFFSPTFASHHTSPTAKCPPYDALCDSLARRTLQAGLPVVAAAPLLAIFDIMRFAALLCAAARDRRQGQAALKESTWCAHSTNPPPHHVRLSADAAKQSRPMRALTTWESSSSASMRIARSSP